MSWGQADEIRRENQAMQAEKRLEEVRVKALEFVSRRSRQCDRPDLLDELAAFAMEVEQAARKEAEEWKRKYDEANRLLWQPQNIKYPFQCQLCQVWIKSSDDLDGHGLGECVEICSSCTGAGFADKDLVAGARREERIKALEESAQIVLSHKWVGHPKYGDEWNSALEEAAEDIRQKVREINAKV